MPATYQPIESRTLGSAASSVTFTGIPQTYTDLVMVCRFINTTGSPYGRFTINGDTGSTYSSTWLEGTYSSASSGRASNDNAAWLYYNGAAGTSGLTTTITHFNNYSNTTTNKSIITRFGSTPQVGTYASLWRNTSAITSLTINAFVENFQANTTLTLYGIKAG
jgi:uncharacterized protein (UPF0333 family)